MSCEQEAECWGVARCGCSGAAEGSRRERICEAAPDLHSTHPRHTTACKHALEIYSVTVVAESGEGTGAWVVAMQRWQQRQSERSGRLAAFASLLLLLLSLGCLLTPHRLHFAHSERANNMSSDASSGGATAEAQQANAPAAAAASAPASLLNPQLSIDDFHRNDVEVAGANHQETKTR